jgi:hypothetical protein
MNQVEEFRLAMRRHDGFRRAVLLLSLGSLAFALISIGPNWHISLLTFVLPIWLIVLFSYRKLVFSKTWRGVRLACFWERKIISQVKQAQSQIEGIAANLPVLRATLRAAEADAGASLYGRADFVLFEKYLWTQNSGGWIKGAKIKVLPAVFEYEESGWSSSTSYSTYKGEIVSSETSTSPDYAPTKKKSDRVQIKGPHLKTVELNFKDFTSAQDFGNLLEDAVSRWPETPKPWSTADIAKVKDALRTLKNLEKGLRGLQKYTWRQLQNIPKEFSAPAAIVKSIFHPLLSLEIPVPVDTGEYPTRP